MRGCEGLVFGHGLCNRHYKRMRKYGSVDEVRSPATHGESRSRLYSIWSDMRGRCRGDDPNYGGRGIAVCAEWSEYVAFRDWALSHGYADDLTIDRIDNDGNYEPSNCQWITKAENSAKMAFSTPNAKLSPDDVRAIRVALAAGEVQHVIASRFGTTQSTVSMIARGKQWSHIR